MNAHLPNSDYALLFSKSPIATIILDQDGVILDLNPATEILCGYKKEELISRHYSKIGFLAEQQVFNIEETFRDFKGKKKVGPLEIQIKKKDSNSIWINLTASIITSKNQTFIQVFAVEISDRKWVEQKLEIIERKFHLITENANDMITILNKNIIIEYVNEKVHKKITGYDLEEIVGRNALDFMHPDDIDKVRRAANNTFNLGEGMIETRLKHKDGHYVWIETNGTIFTDENNLIKLILISRDITERKKTSQKMQSLIDRYKQLTNSLPEVIFELDMNYNLTYTNKVASQIFGYTHDDFLKGLTIFNFTHPDEKKRTLDNLKELYNGKFIKPEIFRLKKKDGSYLYMRVYAYPILEDKHVKGIRAIIHDVTEMKQSEELIKESEERFRAIAEQSLMGITIIQDQFIKYVNKTLAHILGYSVEEMMNWKAGEFFKTIHPSDKKRIIELALKPSMEFKEGIRYYEARAITKLSNVIWLEVYYKEIFFDKKPAFLISFIDITERKKAVEKLRESEKKYRFLFEKSPFLILLINDQGLIIDCNPAVETLADYKKDELIGKAFSELPLLGEEIVPVLVERFKQVMNGRLISPIDIQLIKKDKSRIWVKIESSLINLGDKKYDMVMGSDISKQKKVEENLKQLDEIRKEFINRASHELKTPITTVYGAHELLKTLHMKKFGKEETELIEIAFNGTKRLKKLVDDLLDVSKIESGILRLEKSPCNLSELINNTIKEVSYLLNKKEQHLELDIPNNVFMNIDASRMELVLINLLTNSIKYTHSKGEIKVKLNASPNNVLISIKDTGIGLMKEELEKIFKKFVKIRNPLEEVVELDLGSTGLGLHIAKEIVRLHDGEIWAESEGKGKGTTFYVKLPFEKS
jgi:PAS domain S-box-containing protein